MNMPSHDKYAFSVIDFSTATNENKLHNNNFKKRQTYAYFDKLISRQVRGPFTKIMNFLIFINYTLKVLFMAN